MDASLMPARLELGPRRQPALRGNFRPELQRWSSKRKSEEDDEPSDGVNKALRRGNDSYETTEEEEDTAEEDDGEGGDMQDAPVGDMQDSVPTLMCTIAASPVGGGWHSTATPLTAQPTPHTAAPGSRWTWSAARIASWSGQAGLRLPSGAGLRFSRRSSSSTASRDPHGPAAPEEDALRRTEDEEVSGTRDDSEESDDDKLVTQDLNELMTRACSMERKDRDRGGGRSGGGGGGDQ